MTQNTFKDLFSGHADDYKKYRPTYPAALFEFLAQQVDQHQAAWDCGTGNGQGAGQLIRFFDRVYATDPSAHQIEQAPRIEGINYSVDTAEQCGLPDQSVSLVTVFQALHWFDLDRFFKEVKRVLLPGGVLAVIGYNTVITGIESVDQVYKDFCFEYLWEKNAWAMERESLNNNYQCIDFPFEEINAPAFEANMQWNYYDYLAYINTWSAVKTFIKQYSENPVSNFVVPKIESHWHDKQSLISVKFPLIIRLGRI